MDEPELVNYGHHMISPERAKELAQFSMELKDPQIRPNWRDDPTYFLAEQIKAKRQARLKH